MILDSTHSALLRGIAKNLKDQVAIGVYADYLQEIGSGGVLIVRHYPIKDWPVWLNPERASARRWKSKRAWLGVEKGYSRKPYQNIWSLPWLEGRVVFETWHEQGSSRIKQILMAYAEGRVTE